MRKRSKLQLTLIFLLSAVVLILTLLPSNINSEAQFVYLEGVASWYSEFSPGIRPTTANMEIFDHHKMTCAIWGIPFNTILEVTNMSNGKTIYVRVNDRGPAKRLHKEGRVIDLTMAAFNKIEDLEKGLTKVKVRIIR